LISRQFLSNCCAKWALRFSTFDVDCKLIAASVSLSHDAQFIAPSDPATWWTTAHRWPAFFAYSANYLIDADNAITVDVEATTRAAAITSKLTSSMESSHSAIAPAQWADPARSRALKCLAICVTSRRRR
jgi:hypothetical protein